MKLLAFDTSTDIMSVAVQRDVAGVPQVWHHTGSGGAQASSTLIPTIQSLMDQAGLRFEELDAIAFGQGPGSFTGLRTACSVAQGLAFGASAKSLHGAGVKVLPVDTLLAVAEEARHQHRHGLSRCQIVALLDARMDELYLARYEFSSGRWLQHEDYSLIRPEAVVLPEGWELAGNVFATYRARLPVPLDASCWQALPTATAMLRLAPALLAAGQAVAPGQALPRYIRDKVAKTTMERAAEKAAL